MFWNDQFRKFLNDAIKSSAQAMWSALPGSQRGVNIPNDFSFRGFDRGVRNLTEVGGNQSPVQQIPY